MVFAVDAVKILRHSTLPDWEQVMATVFFFQFLSGTKKKRVCFTSLLDSTTMKNTAIPAPLAWGYQRGGETPWSAMVHQPGRVLPAIHFHVKQPVVRNIRTSD